MMRLLGLFAAVLLFGVPATVLALHGDGWVLLGWIGFPVVGAVILWHKPRNTVGRLMLSVGVLCGVASIGEIPGWRDRMPPWLEALVTAAGPCTYILLIALALVLPSSRLESKLGRLLAVMLGFSAGLVAVLTVLDPALLPSGRTNPLAVGDVGQVADVVVRGPGFLVVPLLLLGAVIDLVRRYRRSDGIERLPYRWLMLGAIITLLVIASFVLETAGTLTLTMTTVLINALPVTIGIAVLRYRLFEIDRVISRTVAYALVIIGVVGTYARVVTSVSRLLPQSQELAVAGATLAAAALFRPLLRAVQERVDRRFNRAKYDATREIEGYALSLRDSVDPREVADGLVAAVDRTLQPAVVGVWRGRPS